MKEIDNVLDKYTVMEENKIRGYHQYMKTKNTDKVADMVMILEKLIDKPMVNIQ